MDLSRWVEEKQYPLLIGAVLVGAAVRLWGIQAPLNHDEVCRRACRAGYELAAFLGIYTLPSGLIHWLSGVAGGVAEIRGDAGDESAGGASGIVPGFLAMIGLVWPAPGRSRWWARTGSAGTWRRISCRFTGRSTTGYTSGARGN